MALGQELAPHLPFLRRFARALTGSQAVGDALVRRTLEEIVASPDSISAFADIRVGLYSIFHALVREASSSGSFGVHQRALTGAEEFALQRLAAMSVDSREALLLTSLEGFASDDVAVIMGVDALAVDDLVAAALEEIERQTKAKVLIVEDEPIIALDLKSIVEDLGHEVVGIATSKETAVRMATPDVGLVLMDIALEDGRTGIAAAAEILAAGSRPLIYITAFPEDLLAARSEPAFLITKPFQRSTVKAAIAQALFFDAATVPYREAESDPPTREEIQPVGRRRRGLPALPSARDLVPRAGPIYAQVTAGRLSIGPQLGGNTALAEVEIEAVRELHRDTAGRLVAEFKEANAGTAIIHRIEALAVTLGEPLDAARSVRLGIQVAGLSKYLPAIQEELSASKFLDIQIFADDLNNLIRQFPAYRTFLAEARDRDAPKTEGSVQRALEALNHEPDNLVEPELKQSLVQLTEQHHEVPDHFTALALDRSLGNIFRAIGRWMKARATALGAGLTKSIDKALLGIVVGVAMVEGGTYLAATYPAEYSWVLQLLEFAKAVVVK